MHWKLLWTPPGGLKQQLHPHNFISIPTTVSIHIISPKGLSGVHSLKKVEPFAQGPPSLFSHNITFLKQQRDARHTSPCILLTFQSVNPPHGQWPAPMGSWRVIHYLVTTLLFSNKSTHTHRQSASPSGSVHWLREGGTKNLGKNDLTYLTIPPIKRKRNSAIPPPPFRRGEIWWSSPSRPAQHNSLYTTLWCTIYVLVYMVIS